jgi:membrane protein
MADPAERAQETEPEPEPRVTERPADAAVALEDLPPPLTSEPDWPKRARAYAAALFRGVWRKAEQDNIFFLAGAISFNVLVAFIPLLLAVVGIAGAVLRFQGANAQQVLLDYLSTAVPAAVDLNVAPILDDLAAKSTGILSVGTLFFLWVATRLVGTLRTVLREIFDIAEGRSIVSGKIFDIKMVFMAGTLFALNVVLTIGLRIGAEFVSGVLQIDPGDIPLIGQARNLWPQALAFFTIWVMFFLVYRYLPPRRIRWSTAATAATFTALIGELLKLAFSWYVTGVADFRSAWGNVATFVILVLWIYYTSVVFILGGEVAQVMAMQRIRKRQKERLA